MTTYNDMSADCYHAHAGVSSTAAKLWLESPQLYRDHVIGVRKRKDSDSMRFGRAAHMRLTEPEKFARLASEGPINERTGKPYGSDTLAYQGWRTLNPGAVIVSHEDRERLTFMVGRMPAEVREILRSPGIAERSYFTDIGGLAVKCRPDWLKCGVIYDLKTIGNIADAEKHISKYRYWFSHAWYRAVIKAESGASLPFRLLFAETASPYRWRIIDIDADWVQYADSMVRMVISDIADAEARQRLCSGAESSEAWADRGPVEMVVSRPAWETDDDDDNEWGD